MALASYLLSVHLLMGILGAVSAVPQNPLYGYPTHPNTPPYPNTSYSPPYSPPYSSPYSPPYTTISNSPTYYPTYPTSSVHETSVYPSYPQSQSYPSQYPSYPASATSYYTPPSYPITYSTPYTPPIYTSPMYSSPVEYTPPYNSASSPVEYMSSYTYYTTPSMSMYSTEYTSPYYTPSTMYTPPYYTPSSMYTPPSYPSQPYSYPQYPSQPYPSQTYPSPPYVSQPYPTQIYPTQPSPSQTYSAPPAPPSTTCGLNINSPNIFELWTYAPGTCDLDNKPVSSSINYPFNVGGPMEYYFINNLVSPPVSYASMGDLWTLTCSSSATAPQAYLRPTHGTPFYFLLFGNPNADPTPQLTLHDDFTLVAGTGAEEGKVFLSYNGQGWVACPGDSNPYNNLTQYSIYWNPDPLPNCVSFQIEVRQGQRQCTC